MTTDFTGTATWRATISGPADGEPRTGDSVSDMGVLLADRTMWLKDALVGRLEVVEFARAASNVDALLLDLGTGTTFVDITGVTVTLASTLQVGDLVVVRASSHVFTDCTAARSNRVEMAIALEGVALNRAYASTESPTFTHVDAGITYLVEAGSVVTPTFSLQGRCNTATGLATAEVYGPYDLTVVHLRPCPEP
jgi:hypothetical protein